MSESGPVRKRMRAFVEGVVQGVGFRPFIHRLATKHGLGGWVRNSPGGVEIEAEGDSEALAAWRREIEQAPPPARIDRLVTEPIAATGERCFAIHDSRVAGDPTALIPPDVATCAHCVREVFDPSNRRYQHPFTNCTYCGPRFTIIEELPYDRARTSMKGFPLCAACQAECDDPADRRFHAQPNACPDCGPQLALWQSDGALLATRATAWQQAAAAIRDGRIVGVKSVGGFQLMVAADQWKAVARLRELKQRDEKPFALLLPDVASVRTWCEVDPVEEELLMSPEAPIVLLRRLAADGGHSNIAPLDGVAPGLNRLGVMLPPTALHHLLVRAVNGPVIATSGNARDEPLCIDDHQAVKRLGSFVELLLVHDRPIVRPVDDSVVRMVGGRELVLRRARGYAPLPVTLAMSAMDASNSAGIVVLGAGGHLKNTVALAVGSRVYLSQHVGDLETLEAIDAHARAAADLQKLNHVEAAVVAIDVHPEYASSRLAAAARRPVIRVQHHFAHLLAALAENGLEPPAFGVIWDGTGDGGDGTIWGGEFLVARKAGFERAGWLRTFALPGGENAIREPRRAALGLLHELLGEEIWERDDLPTLQSFTRAELNVLRGMMRGGVNSPRTSSVGRLFDAVASLVGVRQISRYEGQAAMELEAMAETTSAATAQTGSGDSGCKDFVWREACGDRRGWIADWGPWVMDLLKAVGARSGDAANSPLIARRLHEALAACVVPAATRVGLEHVALSGGCFQNRILTELTVDRLEAAGFRPCRHRRVPPNDGGLALGQVLAARQASGVGQNA